MEVVCKKCGRKMQPIFENHVYNGSESILHGKEAIMNGSENIKNGKEKKIYNYKCPYCDAKYKSGTAKIKENK